MTINKWYRRPNFDVAGEYFNNQKIKSNGVEGSFFGVLAAKKVASEVQSNQRIKAIQDAFLDSIETQVKAALKVVLPKLEKQYGVKFVSKSVETGNKYMDAAKVETAIKRSKGND